MKVVAIIATTTAMVLPVLAGLAAVVIAIRVVTGALFAGRVRTWVRAATFSILAAVMMYAWGGFKAFAWDIKETCTLYHHEEWDPVTAESGWFPLKHECNASYDLVPAYVTPVAVACLLAAAVCIILALRVAYTKRRDGAAEELPSR